MDVCGGWIWGNIGVGITEGVMLDGILPCPFPDFQVCGEEAALGYGLVKVWRRSLG